MGLYNLLSKLLTYSTDNIAIEMNEIYDKIKNKRDEVDDNDLERRHYRLFWKMEKTLG